MRTALDDILTELAELVGEWPQPGHLLVTVADEVMCECGMTLQVTDWDALEHPDAVGEALAAHVLVQDEEQP